jgi:hypothetical protein
VRIAFAGHFRPDGECRTDEDRVAKALARAGARVDPIDARDGLVENRLLAARADWVLFSKLDRPSPSLVDRLRREQPGLKFAQILFDLMDYEERLIRGVPWLRRNRLQWWLPFARRMDVVFLRERGHLERYAREGVHGYYLDQAADADERPADIGPAAMTCDVAFFGSYLPQRETILKRISKDRDLRIYADRPDRWLRCGLRAEAAAYGTRLAEAVAAAKIVYGENARNDVEGYWSDRVYRILGHRGFFLTRYVPGLEDFFTNHEHLVWARDDDEVSELAARYLDDESARRRIAAAGFEHVRARHTYDHRARELLAVLENTHDPRRSTTAAAH